MAAGRGLTPTGAVTEAQRFDAHRSHRGGPWPFGDAPRTLRVEAIDKLPELIEQLVKEASKTAERLQAKIEQARQVVQAIAEPRPLAADQARALSGAFADSSVTAKDAARAMIMARRKK